MPTRTPVQITAASLGETLAVVRKLRGLGQDRELLENVINRLRDQRDIVELEQLATGDVVELTDDYLAEVLI